MMLNEKAGKVSKHEVLDKIRYQVMIEEYTARMCSETKYETVKRERSLNDSPSQYSSDPKRGENFQENGEI